MPVVRNLFISSIVRIEEYVCDEVACCAPVEEVAELDEIVLVNYGLFEKWDKQGKHLIDPTQVVLFQKDEPFTVRHLNDNGDRSIILSFSPELLREALKDDYSSAQSSLGHLPATIGVTGRILLLNKLLANVMPIAPVDPLLVDEMALTLLDAFRQAATKHTERRLVVRARAWDEATAAIREILCERFDQPNSISELARQVALSPFHMCRIFRATTGMTIHEFINILRLSAALDKIGDYPKNLSMLAVDLGFSSHSHFSCVFKTYFKISPSQLSRLRVDSSLPRRVKAILGSI